MLLPFESNTWSFTVDNKVSTPLLESSTCFLSPCLLLCPNPSVFGCVFEYRGSMWYTQPSLLLLCMLHLLAGLPLEDCYPILFIYLF